MPNLKYIAFFIISSTHIRTITSTTSPCARDCSLWCGLCKKEKIATCDNYKLICQNFKCTNSCSMKMTAIKRSSPSRYLCLQICDTDYIFCEAAAETIRHSIHCLVYRKVCSKRCNDQQLATKRILSFHEKCSREMTDKLTCPMDLVHSIELKMNGMGFNVIGDHSDEIEEWAHYQPMEREEEILY